MNEIKCIIIFYLINTHKKKKDFITHVSVSMTPF